MLATGLTMGLEPASGTGASARADSSAHHRVAPAIPSHSEQAAAHPVSSVSIGVWSTHRCYLLENGSLHRSRLSSPARWDAPLSSRKASSPPGTASRDRWKSARGVCGQHSRLPPLSATRALSMEWQCYREASPGECAAASAPGGSRTVAASRDWSRRGHRRACQQLTRQQRIEVSLSPPAALPPTADVILSRAQRAHSRLSWAERLARNARPPTAGHVTIKLFGIPESFAASLGLATA